MSFVVGMFYHVYMTFIHPAHKCILYEKTICNLIKHISKEFEKLETLFFVISHLNDMIALMDY